MSFEKKAWKNIPEHHSREVVGELHSVEVVEEQFHSPPGVEEVHRSAVMVVEHQIQPGAEE